MSEAEGAAGSGSPSFHRQHPLSWIFQTLAAIRSAVIPAVVFFVFVRGFALGWLALLLAAPAALFGIARYLALSYAMGREDLIIRDGILSRNERRIRYARIHNLDEVQGLVHRLVGAVAVKVETASGGKAEAVLHLAPGAATDLREAIFRDRREARRPVGEAEEEPGYEAVLLQLPLGDLVRLGLIQNRGIVIVGAVAALFFQGWTDFGGQWWEGLEDWLPGLLGPLLTGVRELDFTTRVLGALALIIGVYLVLAALSIPLAVVRFFGFTLRRRGEDLIARYGLLTRIQATVPQRRIQRLRVEESLFHRLFGRISLRLDTAGGQGGGSSESDSWSWGEETGTQWLAPVTVVERLRPLVAAALPRISAAPLQGDPLLRASPGTAEEDTSREQSPGTPGREKWKPLTARAIHRLFRKASLLLLIATFLLVWISRWALLLPLGLPLLSWACSRAIACRFYCDGDDALWWRSGWPGRRLVVLPFDKIQSVDVAETPFDRRHGMARVIVDAAGSGAWHAAKITYLDRHEADRLGRRLAREAGRRAFLWS